MACLALLRWASATGWPRATVDTDAHKDSISSVERHAAHDWVFFALAMTFCFVLNCSGIEHSPDLQQTSAEDKGPL